MSRVPDSTRHSYHGYPISALHSIFHGNSHVTHDTSQHSHFHRTRLRREHSSSECDILILITELLLSAANEPSSDTIRGQLTIWLPPAKVTYNICTCRSIHVHDKLLSMHFREFRACESKLNWEKELLGQFHENNGSRKTSLKLHIFMLLRIH